MFRNEVVLTVSFRSARSDLAERLKEEEEAMAQYELLPFLSRCSANHFSTSWCFCWCVQGGNGFIHDGRHDTGRAQSSQAREWCGTCLCSHVMSLSYGVIARVDDAKKTKDKRSSAADPVQEEECANSKEAAAATEAHAQAPTAAAESHRKEAEEEKRKEEEEQRKKEEERRKEEEERQRAEEEEERKRIEQEDEELRRWEEEERRKEEVRTRADSA